MLFLVSAVFVIFSVQSIGALEQDCAEKVWCRNVNWAFRVYPEQSGGFIAKTDDYYSNIVVNLADFNHDDLVDFQEFKNVSETYLGEAFKVFDVDQNGLVSPDEAFIGNVSKALFIRFIRNAFWAADRNGDGQVSTEDLIDAQFEEFDINENGEVSLKELLGRSIIFFPSPIVSIYKILDSNKNEIIEEKEQKNFINFMSRIFNVLDRNADCSVDFEEFLAALESCGLPPDYQLAMDLALRPYISLANYLIKATVGAADVNEDKMISLQEILDFSDVGMDVKPHEVTGPFFYDPNMIPLWYMGGHVDFYGEAPSSEEEKVSKSRRAIANWLVSFQGVMRDTAFAGGKHGHCAIELV